MRKRRRLANKMTIMVCAVLVAVSAFFYAPMEVEAGVSDTVTSFSSDLYKRFELTDSNKIYLKDYLDSDVGYYRVSMDITVNYNSDVDVWLNNFFACFNSCGLFEQISFSSRDWESSHTVTERRDFYLDASASRDSTVFTAYYYFITALPSSPSSLTVNCSYSVSNVLVQEISFIDYDSYTQGYNAGYSAGEQAGYGNGYSQGFTDGEASVDTDAIYDDAFQAGKDSVDTQSYYDAGYQAGYQVAYSEGYESGYDSGYQEALDRIASWGADTSDYPLLLLDNPLISRVFSITVKSSIPTQYSDFAEWTSDLNFNPNHTYRFNVVLNPTEYNEGSADIYFLNSDIFYLNVGGIKYHISNFSGSNVNTFFVPGARMSSAFSFSWEPLLAVMGDTFESGSAFCYYDLNYQIYDMGPSGDTQNHIANQTDQLTNGYDDSKGNQVNSDLSTGLNDYETAENSLFAIATTGLKDFTFFDFESVPAMITGMSFIGSIMGSWFNQAGGASGVGIVLSILFSVILVAMVLGLYRWYQSRGGKN